MSDMAWGNALERPVGETQSYWVKSELRLRAVLQELARDMTGNDHAAEDLLSAVENSNQHPLKDEFVRINYPVLKAWLTLRLAVTDNGPSTRWH